MMSAKAVLPVLILGLAAAAEAATGDQVYWTTRDVLKDFFKNSERVSYVELGTADAHAELKDLLGYVPPKPKYVVFVARTGETIDGYAVIDEEKGQHEQITFAVKLDPTGAVQRTEVMVYREGYGDEIREGRFQNQFVGKRASPPDAFGDIVAISGATISSKSIAVGVRRAAAITAVALRRFGGAAGITAQGGAPVARPKS